ncbi:amino acid decarboxylase [Corallococcus sp. H22C18031201]|nr:amino acid decarboxylase [Corallococcus sp. H22C18031201]
MTTPLTHTPLKARLLSALADPQQTRLDLWNRIREEAVRLAARQSAGEDMSRLRGELLAQFNLLRPLERLWAFPGPRLLARLEERSQHGDFDLLASDIREMVRLLSRYEDRACLLGDNLQTARREEERLFGPGAPHYFTVMVVDTLSPEAMDELRRELREAQRGEHEFVYQLLPVHSLEDALLAALFNSDIQACVLRHDFPLASSQPLEVLREAMEEIRQEVRAATRPRGYVLAELLRRYMPNLDLYLLTDESLAERGAPTERLFRRVFYRYESSNELHATLVDGVRDRYETPFFDALRHYASRPIGNFHALPVARGHSVFNSKWIRDMGDFYGPNIFMAESSSTSGGLDSLLEPTGAIKRAQEKAARAFGAQRSWFVTNGTSTSNKIVLQALTKPGDIVLIDRNCHKSHHYGLALVGAHPVYLDAYPLQPFAIYGAVPLRTLKEKLLELKRAGRLDAVKMVLLTNCTFDGITYHPLHVMEEVLAIKPDVCFLWDEAWYGFAGFMPLSRLRTAMFAAQELSRRLASREYREEYAAWKARMPAMEGNESAWLNQRLMPDPDKARVRVYSTQSTHKSLSAFRQGSMIHAWDQDFERRAAEPFEEAYFTHTSTSPNYQLVASLDLARRQVELEGYGMVKRVYQLALRCRERVHDDPLLKRYYRFLEPADLVPEAFRRSGLAGFRDRSGSADHLRSVTQAWGHDEFVLDPTRMTLFLGDAGIGGTEFRTRVLMNRLGIQVNKTSINSVLFIATIGATWGSLSFLMDGLRDYAEHLDRELAGASAAERRLHERHVSALTTGLPPLPDFSAFHEAFRPYPGSPEGEMRGAFFLAYGEENREHIPLAQALDAVESGRELVSTSLVVPYPPGFPILVPGQVISPQILDFMLKLDVKEVHGYRADLGLSVFTDRALADYAGRQGRSLVARGRRAAEAGAPLPH